MPAGGKASERFPALLEYLPYRKDDDEVMRDFVNHSYFARRGFVGARVDIRGFGNSEGAPPDREYSAQEQQDAEEVIAWLARQSWSNGRVGMLGIILGRFQRNPDGAAETAGTQGHSRRGGHRGIVQGRRALHGRDISRR